MNFDFDFQRYVERRKGTREREVREGAAYAYAGDLKVLRTLDRLKPVKLAVEGAARLWRGSARAELLGPAVKATEAQFAKVHAAAAACGERLHIDPPSVWVTPGALAGGLTAYTFGTDDDAAILLHASLVEGASAAALLAAVGRECGHVQNNHVVYRTALYFLRHSAGTFVRWIVSPAAAALGAWSRRADVTGDRAALICARDLAAASAGLDDGRRAALALFAESAYYTGLSGAPTGDTSEQCDAKVAGVLK